MVMGVMGMIHLTTLFELLEAQHVRFFGLV